MLVTLIKDWISFWFRWGDPERNGKTGKSMKRASRMLWNSYASDEAFPLEGV